MKVLANQDFLEVRLASLIADYDRDTLSNLYQPMIGYEALALYMTLCVRECRIPFEIKAEPIEEVRRKARLSYERMRADAAAAGMQDLSLDEINEIIREVRYGDK